MKKHCETCECADLPAQLSARLGTLSDGGCNFCNRNIGPNGYIDHGQRVWVVTGPAGASRQQTKARFCVDCMRALIASVQR